MANRMILGAHAGTYVFRVSKPGYNVLNEGLLPEQIAFDSRRQNAALILQTGVVNVTANNRVTVAIPDQGFIPIVSYTRMRNGVVSHQAVWYPNEMPGVTRTSISFLARASGTTTFVYVIWRQPYG